MEENSQKGIYKPGLMLLTLPECNRLPSLHQDHSACTRIPFFGKVAHTAHCLENCVLGEGVGKDLIHNLQRKERLVVGTLLSVPVDGLVTASLAACLSHPTSVREKSLR